MSFIFDYVNNILNFYFTSKICYIISLILFFSLLTLGCVSIIILGCVKNARKKSMRWLYYLYQGGYVLEVCIALCEYEYLGLYYKSISSAFLTCSVHFVFLMVVYAIVCVFKMALNHKFDNFVDAVDLLGDDLNEKTFNSSCESFSPKNELKTFEVINDFKNCEKIQTVDLNVAYIDELVNSLLIKDLTDEERQLCIDIGYDIKNLPTTSENTRVKNLNEKLQTLVKKAVQYNIPC